MLCNSNRKEVQSTHDFKKERPMRLSKLFAVGLGVATLGAAVALPLSASAQQAYNAAGSKQQG